MFTSRQRCVDGVCLCDKGYYLVVGVCKPSSAAAQSALAALVASLTVHMQCCVTYCLSAVIVLFINDNNIFIFLKIQTKIVKATLILFVA